MTDPRPAPYPPDTRAKGWRFELDYERIEQSATWGLTTLKPEARPWLLMTWYTAWKQVPCGSMPADPELFAALIGASDTTFAKHRKILLRGWWMADDGLLYHDTLVQRVLEMLRQRRGDADRQAANRAKNAGGLPPKSRVTPTEVQGESSTGTGTGTREETPSLLPQAPAFPPESRPAEPPQLALVEAAKPRAKTVPDCPHQSVLALWAEVLPALPQHNPGMWRGARSDHLRARWRETAASEGWETEADGLAYFRRLFGYVSRSAFLTGRAKSSDGRPPFVAELAWIVCPENWAKVHEGKYHPDAA